MFDVVVLPQPDGPTSTTNDPSAISRFKHENHDMRAKTLLDVNEGNVGHCRPIYEATEPLTEPTKLPLEIQR